MRRPPDSTPVIFEFLSTEDAMARTPYRKDAFKKRFGGLYRKPPAGSIGGFLSTDLQAEVESWPMKADERKTA